MDKIEHALNPYGGFCNECEEPWPCEVTRLRAENERLTLADRQWADHVKRLADDVERLRAALEKYGDHQRFSCTWYSQRVGDPPQCSCGFADLVRSKGPSI